MATVGRHGIEDDFMYGSNVASCHVYIRMRKLEISFSKNKYFQSYIFFFFFQIEFLRKVYGIVATQLCFVALVSIVLISFENLQLFFQNNPSVLLFLLVATIINLLALYIKRLEYPTNFLLLGLFTLFESITIGTIVSFYDKIIVIQAVIITAVIVLGLTAYTFQTKRDFSGLGASLYACLCVLIAGGLIQVK